jgi:hypothetical protein
MKRQITRLTVLQTGKFFAAMYGLVGIILLPLAIVVALYKGIEALALNLAMLILYPLVGFVGGVLLAWMYNIAVKLVGGLEFQVDDAETE